MAPKQSEQLTFTKDYIFYTIQGEGKFVGVPSVFVRLSGCNLRCEWKNQDGTTTRCDTPYSSFTPEKEIYLVSETIEKINSFGCEHVVITGGEPFLQKHVVELINGLVQLKHFVTIETNGTVLPENLIMEKVNFYSISPKLKTSNNELKKSINLDVLAKMTSYPHQLKFVVNEKCDILEIEKLLIEINVAHKKLDLGLSEKSKYQVLPVLFVVLMPQGISSSQLDEKTLWIVDECKKHQWNFSDRLHIRLWGSQRGV